MDEEEKVNRIDDLRDRLYSREHEGEIKSERRPLHERDLGIEETWKPAEEPEIKEKIPFIRILLIVSAVFFVGAAALSSFFFFRVPSISPQNVEIEIIGPSTVGGGDELGLQIGIINKNPVAIHAVNLLVEYPSGTRSALDINIELPRQQDTLGSIEPGEEVKRTVRSVLFGEEGDIQDIKVTVEFRVDSSSAIFFNEGVHKITLSTPPLSLIIDSLKEAVSGQEISFTVTIKSNSKDVIKDALLQVEYPFGFKLTKTSPDPDFAERLWHLGDILPERKKEITFSGVLTGQDGEERVFRFGAGIESKSDPNILGTAFINTIESVFVKRPFISVNLALDGDGGDDHVVRTGRQIRADILWENNLTTQIFDGEIEVVLDGNIVNKSSVSVDEGFYQSVTNTILFDRQTKEKLASISAGEKGSASFTFSTLGQSSGSFRNPEIQISVTVRGKRLSDTQVPEEITSTLTRRVLVASDLLLLSEVLYSEGPFTNSGPIPPQAEQATTYTMHLIITNSSNRIADGKVVTTLPSYVEWMNVTSPASEEITYNPIGGEITWNLGEIADGVGTTVGVREVYFQIRMISSISQIGSAPVLLNNQTLSGFDRFVRETLVATANALNTRSGGSSSGGNQGIVVP